jgi:hypothetical protein
MVSLIISLLQQPLDVFLNHIYNNLKFMKVRASELINSTFFGYNPRYLLKRMK